MLPLVLIGIAALGVAGCNGRNPDDTDRPDDDTGVDPNDCVDQNVNDCDGDGSPATQDCDDNDPNNFPGNTEDTTDGQDNNCNGEVDEDESSYDGDGDGYVAADDCDDTRANVNPSEDEVCGDGLDNDCDERVDECYPETSSLGDADYVQVYGDYTNGLLGYSVAGVGDIDDDGYDDYMTCAPGEEPYGNGEGQCFVLYGDGDGLDTSRWVTINGGANDTLATSLFGGYDVDGDGVPDTVVGEINRDSNHGAVFFFSGAHFSGTMSVNDADAILNGENDGDSAGHSVGMGDLNGDGVPDVVTGANSYRDYILDGFSYSHGSGKIYAVDGTDVRDMDLVDAGFSVEGGDGEEFGYSVSADGDLNGDGYDDLVVGATGNRENGYVSTGTDWLGRGAVYVFRGSSGFFSGERTLASATASLYAPAFAIEGGKSVSTSGDADGDGKNDILIGINSDELEGGGMVYLVEGDVTGTHDMDDPSINIATITHSASGARFGTSVLLKDLNGDGFAEVIVGAPGSNAAEDGAKVYVYYGPVVGNLTEENADAVLDNSGFGSAGWAVASAGDADNNGALDLIVGAPGFSEDGVYAGGAIYVVLSELIENPDY